MPEVNPSTNEESPRTLSTGDVTRTSETNETGDGLTSENLPLPPPRGDGKG